MKPIMTTERRVTSDIEVEVNPIKVVKNIARIVRLLIFISQKLSWIPALNCQNCNQGHNRQKLSKISKSYKKVKKTLSKKHCQKQLKREKELKLQIKINLDAQFQGGW